MGYLPVALAAAAKKRGGPVLTALGLEFFENFESRENMHSRAERLKAFGKHTAILLDYDEKTGKERADTQKRLKDSAAKADAVFVWSNESIFEGGYGCDLETVLAKGTTLSSLIDAVKSIYSTPGHEIDKNQWQTERSKVLRRDCPLFEMVPEKFPDPNSFSFDDLDEKVARLTLFTLMHGPHSMKTSRDMRRLAELLNDDVPEAVMFLYDKLRGLLEDSRKVSKIGYWNLWKGVFVDINQSA